MILYFWIEFQKIFFENTFVIKKKNVQDFYYIFNKD